MTNEHSIERHRGQILDFLDFSFFLCLHVCASFPNQVVFAKSVQYINNLQEQWEVRCGSAFHLL